MKKILFAIAILFFSHLTYAHSFQNDKELNKYLNTYSKELAKFWVCGDYETIDVANLGIYLDEMVTSKYLAVLIKRHGSYEKAGLHIMNKAETLAKQERKRLLANGGLSKNACQRLYTQ